MFLLADFQWEELAAGGSEGEGGGEEEEEEGKGRKKGRGWCCWEGMNGSEKVQNKGELESDSNFGKIVLGQK